MKCIFQYLRRKLISHTVTRTNNTEWKLFYQCYQSVTLTNSLQTFSASPVTMSLYCHSSVSLSLLCHSTITLVCYSTVNLLYSVTFVFHSNLLCNSTITLVYHSTVTLFFCFTLLYYVNLLYCVALLSL